MEAYSKDISRDPENKKEYNRTYYYCKNDDVYILVEIPVKKEENLA
jgi:hypothetical protein